MLLIPILYAPHSWLAPLLIQVAYLVGKPEPHTTDTHISYLGGKQVLLCPFTSAIANQLHTDTA